MLVSKNNKDENSTRHDSSRSSNRLNSTASKGFVEFILKYGGQVGALLFLIIVFSLTSPVFFTKGNFLNIALQSSVGLLLAVGQTYVILSAGIDLSNASVLALAACVSGVAMTSWGLNPYLGIFFALAVGAAVGLVNGLVITKGRIPDFIATLGMSSLASGSALIIAGGLPIIGIPKPIVWMGSGEVATVPVAAIIAFIVTAIGWFILKYTKLGRSIYAVGGNVEAARVSGIDPVKTKIAVYVFSGITAAVAGLVLTGRLNSANGLMGSHWLLLAIAAVIIGGTNLFGGEGSIGGTLVGMLILGTLTNGLNLLNVSNFIQQVIQGGVIIAVVVYDQWRRRRTR